MTISLQVTVTLVALYLLPAWLSVHLALERSDESAFHCMKESFLFCLSHQHNIVKSEQWRHALQTELSHGHTRKYTGSCLW